MYPFFFGKAFHVDVFFRFFVFFFLLFSPNPSFSSFPFRQVWNTSLFLHFFAPSKSRFLCISSESLPSPSVFLALPSVLFSSTSELIGSLRPVFFLLASLALQVFIRRSIVLHLFHRALSSLLPFPYLSTTRSFFPLSISLSLSLLPSLSQAQPFFLSFFVKMMKLLWQPQSVSLRSLAAVSLAL